MYLVTTHATHLPTDRQIVMVDGTVPDWEAKPGDLHWDHHRPSGANVQIDEIPMPPRVSAGEAAPTLIEAQSTGQPPCFVTTMADADACCAAAWVQLSHQDLRPETIDKLKAIAWDCDHLTVPAELKQYAEFAAKAVATLNNASEGIAADLGLPHERKEWADEHWEAYYSEDFRRGTEWLIEAAQGKRPYPGESGEADDYWRQIEADTQMLIDENRIRFIETDRGDIAVCDQTSTSHAIDPRSFYNAIPRLRDASGNLLRPEAIIVRNQRSGGVQYTLGSIPLHPQQHKLDFTQGTFDRLTQAEQAKDPEAGEWGGRRTVGASPWSLSSHLSVEEIVALLD